MEKKTTTAHTCFPTVNNIDMQPVVYGDFLLAHLEVV